MGDIDDRMKGYEGVEAGRRFIPLLPVCARLDGKCFSTFTKGLMRPFDDGMHNAMFATAEYLAKETNACMAYTESDEITLVWYSPSAKSQIFFDGRIQKMTSILAAMASVKFNELLPEFLPSKVDYKPSPLFDCRVWNVPTLEEAVNVLIWREQDASRNSVQMAASSVYSEKELFKKTNSMMQDMLMQKGINWNIYPTWFKRGAYIQRRKVARKFTADEISSLPEKHEARKTPDLEIVRTDFYRIPLPPFAKVENRVEVVFEGATPICKSH